MDKLTLKTKAYWYVPRQYYEYLLWLKRGKKGGMPHLAKRRLLKQFAKLLKASVLVETGTYLGEMVWSLKDNFKKIYSIELSARLYQMASLRFKQFSQIKIIQGDSAKILPNLVLNIGEPAMFWLDGHYSAGITAKGDLNTPIIQELKFIFEYCPKPVGIFIDDARCFNGSNDYPEISQLKKFVAGFKPDWRFEIRHDVICIYGPQTL